ncbi:hypothetical protein CHARACLAT_026845, partial [Characodon lateralis]|nr:hypothetical protein [Characodon lateralis]
GHPNKDTDIEHMPPNPNATNHLPHRGTPPQVNSIAERPMKPHPPSASSTLSPALSTPAAPPPHSEPQRQGKARASRNTTPAHRRNRADPTKIFPFSFIKAPSC